MTARLTGGCQCGALRYALSAAPSEPSLCHCRMCQKAVGQPFAALGSVKLAEFAWTRGTPAAWRSSSAAERQFCAICGTPLTFRYFHADRIGVAMGSFDDPNGLAPVQHDGVEARLRWMMPDVLAALPEVATMNPGTPEPVRTLVNFQHPDHDTPDGWTPPAA